MEILKLTISKDLQDELISHLLRSIVFDYTDITPGITILALEEYYFRNNAAQLNLIIIKRVDLYLQIDLIGGGGATGLLGLDLGSEKAFIRKARKILQAFCEDRGEKMEIIA